MNTHTPCARTREWQVPVIFDVEAENPLDAARACVDVLAAAQIPGRRTDAGEVVSWWTVEGIAKPFDGNDNDAGIVLFADDVDYLHDLLVAVDIDRLNDRAREGDLDAHNEITRLTRLLHYLHPYLPDARIGSFVRTSVDV